MNQLRNDIDDHVDAEIYSCLNLSKPKSFFLFAGAGSGKTKSLVSVLNLIDANYGKELKLRRQKVAVITYTNAACEEIKHRIDYNSLFHVSTIHSFVWEVIRTYQADIKEFIKESLIRDIEELKLQQAKGRSGTKAAIDRENKIKSKTRRLENIDDVKSFSYSPTGDNRTRDSLNHSEVIELCAHFISSKPLMRKLIVHEFPILLVDESQDTNKHLMSSFFILQKEHPTIFALGLFGDLMQRIYSDGLPELGQNIPSDWATPSKKMNHRCPKRVITLINKIRSVVDGQEQQPRTDKIEGHVRFFIVNSSNVDKKLIEQEIRTAMASITSDSDWIKNNSDFKCLTLEHHMAASRMGFLDLFEPLYKNEKLKTGLLDGELSGLKFFTDIILPLVKARNTGDNFEITRIVKENSLFFQKDTLQKMSNQLVGIEAAREAVENLFSLWIDNSSPSLIDVLRNIAKSGLFPIPRDLLPIAIRTDEEQLIANKENTSETEEVNQEKIEEEKEDDNIKAWDLALSANFSQLELYDDYISERSIFGTHQGVKGLEFSRVLVIIDDEEANGFMFSYDKLFGLKELTDNDLKNERDGKDSGVARTRRLFYVTCSRAKQGLAIAAYTNNPDRLKESVLNNGWFSEHEIVVVGG